MFLNGISYIKIAQKLNHIMVILTCALVKGDVRGFGMIWFCGVIPYSWSSKWYGDGVRKVVMVGSVKIITIKFSKSKE